MIVWNRVTWYSRYLALIFFTIIFPLWAFYLGTQYQSAQTALLDQPSITTNIQNSSSTPVVESLPTSTSTEEINSGIKGTVTIGPTCPVERVPTDPNCADKPYDPDLIFTNTKTNITKSTKVSENGKFSITLSPGIYTVKDKSDAILPRMSDIEPVIVSANTYTDIRIEFDSGIR